MSHTHAPHSLEEVTAIRAHGRRVTWQRTLIWDALRTGGHMSAREVCEAVSVAAPELHQATIYRALEIFTEEGLVRRTEIDGRSLYEIASDHRHHHVVCTSCGVVAHVHDKELQGAFVAVERESGFTLGGSEITFYGTCPNCLGA